jgi:hypothetical protein
MWFDYVNGWLFCLHATEFVGRTCALVRWQRPNDQCAGTPTWASDLRAGKVPAIVMLLAYIFSFMGAVDVLGSVLHFACVIDETLADVSPWKCVGAPYYFLQQLLFFFSFFSQCLALETIPLLSWFVSQLHQPSPAHRDLYLDAGPLNLAVVCYSRRNFCAHFRTPVSENRRVVRIHLLRLLPGS